MSVVAVFVFAHRCESCTKFKDIVYEGHKSVYDIVRARFIKKGICVKTYYNTDGNLPQHLRIMTFFPSVMLLPSDVFYNTQSVRHSNIYHKIKIFDANIIQNQHGKYVAGEYQRKLEYLNPSDYDKFLDQYMSEINDKPTVTRLVPSASPAIKYYTNTNTKIIRSTYK